MARYRKAQIGHKLAMAALFAGLTAAPALAQNVPLPTPRPALDDSSAATGSIAARFAIPGAALRARAQAAQPQVTKPAAQPPNPVSNPFAALLGQRGPAIALSPDQRSIVERVNNYLSSMRTLIGQIRPGRPRRPPHAGRLLYFQTRQGAFRIRRPEPDRVDRRRRVGGGARPPAGDAGHLSAVADAAALPARRPCQPDEGHQPDRGFRRRCVSSPWWSRRRTAWSAPAG